MALMQFQQERRLLQVVVFMAACVPVAAGLTGMVVATMWFGGQGDTSFDSHVRYLSGLLCGVGLNFWWIIPRIERHTTTVRVLTSLVVLGGFTRLAAAVLLGMPSLPMQMAIGMELLVTPLLCLWQGRIARLAH